MRQAMPSLIAACLLTAVVPPAAVAQGNANADICAATDESSVMPEQRIGACNALIKASRKAPKDLAAALVNRGSAYWTIDKMKLAFADFNRAIALDPDNSRAFRERANAFRSDGKLDRALSDATEAVRLNPKDAAAYNIRGNVLSDQREYERAIEDYNQALQLDPQFSMAFRDRGAAF